ESIAHSGRGALEACPRAPGIPRPGPRNSASSPVHRASPRQRRGSVRNGPKANRQRPSVRAGSGALRYSRGKWLTEHLSTLEVEKGPTQDEHTWRNELARGDIVPSLRGDGVCEPGQPQGFQQSVHGPALQIAAEELHEGAEHGVRHE